MTRWDKFKGCWCFNSLKFVAASSIVYFIWDCCALNGMFHRYVFSAGACFNHSCLVCFEWCNILVNWLGRMLQFSNVWCSAYAGMFHLKLFLLFVMNWAHFVMHWKVVSAPSNKINTQLKDWNLPEPKSGQNLNLCSRDVYRWHSNISQIKNTLQTSQFLFV